MVILTIHFILTVCFPLICCCLLSVVIVRYWLSALWGQSSSTVSPSSWSLCVSRSIIFRPPPSLLHQVHIPDKVLSCGCPCQAGHFIFNSDALKPNEDSSRGAWLLVFGSDAEGLLNERGWSEVFSERYKFPQKCDLFPMRFFEGMCLCRVSESGK